jgi:hypothetical protein
MTPEERKQRYGKSQIKKYIITHTTGEEVLVDNLKDFCEANNIYYESLVINKRLIKSGIKEVRVAA